jgi:hypothetical protein
MITDISDFPNSVKKLISRVLTKGKIEKEGYRIHLIDCSLCQNWWCGLIYLLVTGNFTLMYIAIVALFAAFSGLIKSSILLIEDTITKIIQLIYKYVIDR